MLSRLTDALPVALRNRDAFLRLVGRDLTERYLATKMGFVWAILEPASFILLLWIIFSNFRTTPESEAPFLLYLSVGYSIWLFVSSAVVQTTNVMRQYAFLVTKVSFPIWLLPCVKVTSQLIVHWVFMCLIACLLMYEDYMPSMLWLQLLYLQFAAAYLVLGITLFTCAVNVYFKDVHELVTIIMRFGFWLTPVFWSVDLLPQGAREWMDLSPFYWLVSGYRDVLLHGESVFQADGTLWFWGLSTTISLIGAFVFIRLRPYFAEIL